MAFKKYEAIYFFCKEKILLSNTLTITFGYFWNGMSPKGLKISYLTEGFKTFYFQPLKLFKEQTSRVLKSRPKVLISSHLQLKIGLKSSERYVKFCTKNNGICSLMFETLQFN